MHGSQLSSLRGSTVVQRNGTNVNSDSETPVVRFLEEPDEENTWNQFRKLSDKEISRLAKAMVKQVKLRGPFLSFSDFVNRRLVSGPDNSEKEAAGSTMNFMKLELNKWSDIAPENISTVTGLRGAVQSAIAESGLNDSKFLDSWKIKGQTIPVPPNDRWSGSSILTTEFGLRASTRQFGLIQGQNNRFWGQGEHPPGYDLPDWAANSQNYWGKKITLVNLCPTFLLVGMLVKGLSRINIPIVRMSLEKHQKTYSQLSIWQVGQTNQDGLCNRTYSARLLLSLQHAQILLP